MTEPIINKVCATADDALDGIDHGVSVAVGGFGTSGVPVGLIEALLRRGTHGLEIVSNNCGLDGWGLGRLLEAHRVRRAVGSYVGENREFGRQLLAGEVEVELIPQGTFAERLRAGGSGIPAFYTRAGVGTWVAEGGLPWKYGPGGSVTVASPPKESRTFDGDEYILERAISTDVAFVHAWKGDRHGNLVYRRTARNFNPLCAMAGRLTIAEVEVLVEPGELDPDLVHTPGIFVQRVVHIPDGDKPIEKLMVRP